MLQDSYGREVNYLRVSVTERCNFRCQYCMPDKPFSWVPKENLLSYEELFSFIKIGIDNGIKKVRITGGEPTTRGDLDHLIRMITNYAPDIDIALTTNGYLLAPLVERLRDAGLQRINISLDSLEPETMHYITKKDVFNKVMLGIEKAVESGMKVKLNTVILKKVNENEIVSLFEFAKNLGVQIRYIEFMENSFANQNMEGYTSDEILSILSETHSFSQLLRSESGPATLYETDDGYRFGTIAPHKHDFCETCNRLRLTAEGDLIPCLYFDEAMSIKESVRNGELIETENILKTVVENKPEKNRWDGYLNEDKISSRAFYQTGG